MSRLPSRAAATLTGAVSVALIAAACGAISGEPTVPILVPAPATRDAAPARRAAAARPVSPAVPTTRQLAADATITTPSQATFAAPKGWWITEGGGAVVLADPDRGLTVTLIEVAEPDPAAAIAAAWQVAQPGFARAAHDPVTGAPGGGWGPTTHIDYVTATAERRVVIAEVRRFAGVSYVALLDADQGAAARRGAQVATMLETLRAPGMHDESFVGLTPRPIDAARAAELDAFIEKARRDLEVPGAAVAIVAGGKVVYERGFGVRAVGQRARVTPRTLFLMGSITKSMTTMMQATLVDDGVLTWETPVTTLLPGFAVGDAGFTERLVLWHMSCACTGMPQQNMETLFEYGSITAEQRVASMQAMRPTTAFGETYQYSNVMVMAGGYAAAHAADPTRPLGAAYDAVMRRKVFAPIGMISTTFDFRAAVRAEHAAPHAVGRDGATRALPLAVEHMVVPIRPAGGVWSNLRDMTRFVMTEMAGGVTPEGTRVVSEASLLARRTPRIRSGGTDSYGLGLSVGTYAGLPVVEHSGGTFGFRTRMVMLPEQGVAVVILTNTTGADGAFTGAVHRRVMEALFDGAAAAGEEGPHAAEGRGPPGRGRTIDALAARQLEADFTARRARLAQELDGVEVAPDAAWLGGLVGTYRDASLGTVRIRARRGAGTFDAGEWTTRFGRRKGADGSVKLVFLDPPVAGGELVVGGDAAHPTLTVDYDQQAYVFERTGT